MTSTKPFVIPKRLIWGAYRRVKANRGAAGVDAVSIEQFDENRNGNLYRIWNRLSSGSYFPPAVRAVPIPKKSGGERMLGVPTVSDRIAQTAVVLALEPEWEKVFHPDSYGYRPGRSAHDALEVTRRRCWRRDWVLEYDIRGLFDNIDHELLRQAVRYHCKERWIDLRFFSRLVVESLIDFQGKVPQIVKAVCFSFDDFDLVVHPFQFAGVDGVIAVV